MEYHEKVFDRRRRSREKMRSAGERGTDGFVDETSTCNFPTPRIAELYYPRARVCMR